MRRRAELRREPSVEAHLEGERRIHVVEIGGGSGDGRREYVQPDPRELMLVKHEHHRALVAEDRVFAHVEEGPFGRDAGTGGWSSPFMERTVSKSFSLSRWLMP